tara:strand:+ start:75 stop:770 length:696 start_codon:yes stop_codon:yes gene_type:complete
MDLFYSKNILEHRLSLDESKHCLISLRKNVHDQILITDGKGLIYTAEIKKIDNHHVIYDNLDIVHKDMRSKKLHIVVAPPKNKVRFEWLLEKVTEIGVDMISPIICEHSERVKINQLRSERVLISAMKQSKNSILPTLNKIESFEKILKKYTRNTYIAHCYDTDKMLLKNVEKMIKQTTDITLFIGPEGDFSKKELNFAEKEGVIPITLGTQRLRTETAAIVGCYMIKSLM